MADMQTLIELAEGAAKARKDPVIPRDFITEAVEKINRNEEECDRYPTGAPTMIGIYKVASRLYKESTQ